MSCKQCPDLEFKEVLSEEELSLVHYVSSIVEDAVSNCGSDVTQFGDDFSEAEVVLSGQEEVDTDDSDEVSNCGRVSGYSKFSNDDDFSVDSNITSDCNNSVYKISSDSEIEDVSEINSDNEDNSEDTSSSYDDIMSIGDEEEGHIYRDLERRRLMLHMDDQERVEYMIRVIVEEAVSELLVIKESIAESLEMKKIWSMILISQEMTLMIPKIISSCDGPSQMMITSMSNFTIKERREKDIIILLLLVGVIAFMPRNSVVLRRLRHQLGRNRSKLGDRVRLGEKMLSILGVVGEDMTVTNWSLKNCFY